MEKEEQDKKTSEASEKSEETSQRSEEPEEKAASPAKGTDASAEAEKDTREKAKNLNFVLDIPLEVSVELGRTRMIINDLLQLGRGSVIELTKLAGEPMEILVNQKLIARGEVVVVNEKFGVRLTDIISPIERVEQLR